MTSQLAQKFWVAAVGVMTSMHLQIWGRACKSDSGVGFFLQFSQTFHLHLEALCSDACVVEAAAPFGYADPSIVRNCPSLAL